MATETRRDGIDLILTRYYAAPPEKLWQAWTDVDVLKTWFAPDPVKITEAVCSRSPCCCPTAPNLAAPAA